MQRLAFGLVAAPYAPARFPNPAAPAAPSIPSRIQLRRLIPREPGAASSQSMDASPRSGPGLAAEPSPIGPDFGPLRQRHAGRHPPQNNRPDPLDDPKQRGLVNFGHYLRA